jgi:hypothetical protein
VFVMSEFGSMAGMSKEMDTKHGTLPRVFTISAIYACRQDVELNGGIREGRAGGEGGRDSKWEIWAIL